jgi:DNA polymerase phi
LTVREDEDENITKSGDEEEDEEEEEGEGEEGGSEGSSSQEDGGDDDSSPEATDVELRDQIKKALQDDAIEALSGKSVSDSDEELMDDDQMLAMDEKLVAVFKAKLGEKRAGQGWWLALLVTICSCRMQALTLSDKRSTLRTESLPLSTRLSRNSLPVLTSSVSFYPSSTSLQEQAPTSDSCLTRRRVS